jgi:hypothetical protein
MKLSLLRGVAPVLVAAALAPRAAHAQDAPPPPATTPAPDTTSRTTGPSLWMLGSGLTVFGFAYVPVVIVGATSGLTADRTLFVPVVGPWIDLAQRPGCSPASTCNVESSAKVLLVVDGVFQAIGALTILGSFLNVTHESTPVERVASVRPTVRVTPAQMGTGGYGMVALGTF